MLVIGALSTSQIPVSDSSSHLLVMSMSIPTPYEDLKKIVNGEHIVIDIVEGFFTHLLQGNRIVAVQ